MPLLMKTGCPHRHLGFTCQSKIGCSLSPLSRLCCCRSGCCSGSARRGGSGRCREAPGRLPPVSGAPAAPDDCLLRLATMPQTPMQKNRPEARVDAAREAHTQRCPGAPGCCEHGVRPASEKGATLQQHGAKHEAVRTSRGGAPPPLLQGRHGGGGAMPHGGRPPQGTLR